MSDDWFNDYLRQALDEEDESKIRLAWLVGQAYDFRETDPDTSLGMIAEGRALAEQLGEPWWMLRFDEYRVHALLHFKRDYRKVLDLAIQNTLTVRKPQYTDFPRRLDIYQDLVFAYLGIDPLGHAEQVRDVLTFLDKEVPEEGSDRYMLQAGFRQLALDCGQYDEAERAIQTSLALADRDPDRERAEHFSVFVYCAVAGMSWRRRDLDRLRESVEVGEEIVRKVGHKVELAEMLMWQALLARQDRRQDRAARLYRQAVSTMTRVRMPGDEYYFEARCAYHSLAGELPRALSVRQSELATVLDRGRFHRECKIRIELCRLLAEVGQPLEAELAAARTVVGQLRRTEPYLAELARIAAGEPGASAPGD
jgi:hypothetical protein